MKRGYGKSKSHIRVNDNIKVYGVTFKMRHGKIHPVALYKFVGERQHKYRESQVKYNTFLEPYIVVQGERIWLDRI